MMIIHQHNPNENNLEFRGIRDSYSLVSLCVCVCVVVPVCMLFSLSLSLSHSPLCSYRPMKEKNVGNKKWHSGFPLLPWQQLSVCRGWGSRQSATHKGKNTQHVLFHLRSSLSPFLYLSLISPRCLKFQ